MNFASTPKSPAAMAVAAVAGSRLPVLLIGAVAVALVGTIPPPTAEAQWRVSSNELLNMLARWDTQFYYSIATEGYRWDPAVFSHQNVVFFPLYPLLMRWIGAALGGHPLAAGLVISLGAFAGAVVLLYRLAVLEIGETQAWPAVRLLIFFPYALFFSVDYTESLFLLVTVGAFYSMRRGLPVRAALCGLAAGLTRPNGMWLAVPLLWLAISGRPGRARAFAVIAACAPLLGSAIFSAYLHVRFGDALAWVHGQAAWGTPLLGRAAAPDPVRLPTEARIKPTEVVTWIGNIAAFVMSAIAVRPVARKLGLAYAAWIIVNIVPPVAAHLFISLGRFVSVLFPVFFWLALRVPRPRLPAVVGAFAAGQAVLAIWFFLWRPVV